MPHRLFWTLILPITFLISACTSTQNRAVAAKTDVAIPPPTVPTRISTEAIEARKYKVVRRTYELTDDMLVYCAQVPRKQRVAHQKLVEQFWTNFPQYRQLLLASPYYAQVQAENHSTPNQYGYSPEVYQKECQYYQDVLRDWMDDPKDVADFFSILNAQP